MKARNILPKVIALVALAAAAWALAAGLHATRVRAQIDPGYMPIRVEFSQLILAPGQTLNLNAAHNGAVPREVPATLSLEVSARIGLTRGADGGAVSEYQTTQRISRDLVIVPGRSLSLEYTNTTGAAVQVRGTAQLAGIDTPPGSSVQGIETSPTIVSLELREAGKSVVVMNPAFARKTQE